MFEDKINFLKSKIIEMGNLAVHMLEKSINGLIQKDKNILLELIEVDEPKMNELEVEIDELCINFIARYQPEASILRNLAMALKMNNDLERIGDMAVNIAQSALFLIERPQLKPLIDIPLMAKETIQMIKDGIEAFINLDSELAVSICQRDDLIDSYRDQILRELITYMISDPSSIERAIHLERISRNIERIADLATNIGENVFYIVKGKLIKHGRYKDIL